MSKPNKQVPKKKLNIPLSVTTNSADSQALINYFHHLSDVILHLKGEWKTLKYKLHRHLFLKYHQKRDRIVGVRFGKTTKYLAADIDRLSSIHPAENPIGFGKFLEAMEKIGLTRHIKLQSSWSGGLHIYFSLPKEVNTYDAACLMRWACLKAGLVVTPGHLELFPNTKNYVPYNPENPKQQFSLYNGLRLPCQPGTGSFLLDADFNPVGDRIETFLHWAAQDAEGQDFAKFRRYLRSARTKLKKIEKQITQKLSQNAQDWKEDLEEIIATGWTGQGQTNDLISRIVRYAIVFMGKAGESLRAWVKHIAINAPGYQQWCRHCHEIDRKIEHWCRATENHKRYLSYRNFPVKMPFRKVYGEDDSVTKSKNQNELKAEAASERIRKTVEKLTDEGDFPAGAVARTEAIAIASQEMFGASISKSTLRKKANLPLWHPKHRTEETQPERQVSYTSELEMTKSDRGENHTEQEVSYTLLPMKCMPKAGADGQITVEQALSKLASKPVDSEFRPPLSKKSKITHDRDRPKTKILSSAFTDFKEILKVKSQLESRIKILTREEIHKKYPGKKTIPKSDRNRIESSWRARLYWESGIPRLMNRSEEIWQELGEYW